MEVTNTSGRRKTSVARAYITKGKGNIVVNGKDYKEYFKTPRNQSVAMSPFELTSLKNTMNATVMVSGGGINAQADAVKNAIARALVNSDAGLRKALKQAGYLTRDARMVERKKYGLHKARRAPQWAKR